MPQMTSTNRQRPRSKIYLNTRHDERIEIGGLIYGTHILEDQREAIALRDALNRHYPVTPQPTKETDQ